MHACVRGFRMAWQTELRTLFVPPHCVGACCGRYFPPSGVAGDDKLILLPSFLLLSERLGVSISRLYSAPLNRNIRRYLAEGLGPASGPDGSKIRCPTMKGIWLTERKENFGVRLRPREHRSIRGLECSIMVGRRNSASNGVSQWPRPFRRYGLRFDGVVPHRKPLGLGSAKEKPNAFACLFFFPQ